MFVKDMIENGVEKLGLLYFEAVDCECMNIFDFHKEF